MKKLFTFVVLCIASIAFAQPKFAPGFRGGVNFSKISDTDLDFKTDFYVAGFAGVKFTNVYTLQPELGYSRQGTKGDYEFYNGFEDETASIDISLSYLSLTIMNKFTFADRVSVMIGPHLDFLLDNSDNVRIANDADVGITAGVGCLLVDGLGIEFRVKKGFVSTIDNDVFTDNTGFFEVDQASNLALQLGLTYTFDVK
ncbi:MAG: PorT family protein [Proteobacteria bacterium]|nr:MAG: PorT family protein [Pseudomonadota bacterium]